MNDSNDIMRRLFRQAFLSADSRVSHGVNRQNRFYVFGIEETIGVRHNNNDSAEKPLNLICAWC
jgi:hypothetical protein